MAASQPSPGSTVRGAPLGLEEMGGGLTCRTRWSPRPPPVAMFVSRSACPSQGPRGVKCSEPGVRQSPPKPAPPGLSSFSRRVCTDAGRIMRKSHVKVPPRAGCPIQHHWPHVAIFIDSNEIKLKRQLRSCSGHRASSHMLHGIEQFYHHRASVGQQPSRAWHRGSVCIFPSCRPSYCSHWWAGALSASVRPADCRGRTGSAHLFHPCAPVTDCGCDSQP